MSSRIESFDRRNSAVARKAWYGPGRPTRLGISACCLAAFLFFGFDQGVFSGILQNENWLDLFNHPVSRPFQKLKVDRTDRNIE